MGGLTPRGQAANQVRDAPEKREDDQLEAQAHDGQEAVLGDDGFGFHFFVAAFVRTWARQRSAVRDQRSDRSNVRLADL